MKQFLFCILLLSVLLSCGSRNNSQTDEQSARFTLPSIPALIVEPEQKMGYLALHYWQKADWSDTLFLQDPSFESHFRDFSFLLSKVDTSTVATAILHLADSLTKYPTAFAQILYQSEEIFNHPNSELRNEDIFICFLRSYIASPSIDETEKIRPTHLLSTALKNRIGTVAADFIYQKANGKQYRLKDLQTPYILIYFNNPDCHDCARVKQLMAESSVLNKLIAERKITLLALYPDQDISIWQRTPYPSNWINGFDPTPTQAISSKELYDLRAIPNIYLLNQKKEVVFKDIPFEVLEEYLRKQ